MSFYAFLFFVVGTVAAFPDYEKSCEGKADPGRCMAYFPMYYYDGETDTCKKFIYGGCQGNGNRYATEEDCVNKCKGYSQKAVDVCSLLPETGKCRGRFPRYYFDQESGECKVFIYGGCGGNGNRFESIDECRKGCSGQLSEDVCSLPPETGMCRGYFPMYHFDKESGECKEFIYGGCGGNGNRFSSMDECKKGCSQLSVSREVCSLEPETGPCKALFRKYYYNSKTGQCEKFIYGGCGGNDNKFNSADECYNSCSATRSESPNCDDQPDSGICKGAFPRYYYDKNSDKCSIFIYGGCGGNGNNYKSELDCANACKK